MLPDSYLSEVCNRRYMLIKDIIIGRIGFEEASEKLFNSINQALYPERYELSQSGRAIPISKRKQT